MHHRSISQLSLTRKLTLNQLSVFESILRVRSFVGAANEMRLTQSAVTKIVQELEACFEVPLFQRSSRGVIPTELAELLSPHVVSLLAQMRCLTDTLDEFRMGTGGQVMVGTLISAAAQLVPDAIVLLKESAPQVRVVVREGPTAQLFPALATSELDVVVGRLPEADWPVSQAFLLSHHPLLEEGLCIVAGPAQRFGAGERMTLRQLIDGPWILPNTESPFRATAETLFHAAGLPLPQDVVESLSLLTNLGIMSRTPRVALLPSTAAQQLANLGCLQILPVDGIPCFGDVGFSVRKDRPLSPAVGLFLECLRRVGPGAGHTIETHSGTMPG